MKQTALRAEMRILSSQCQRLLPGAIERFEKEIPVWVGPVSFPLSNGALLVTLLNPGLTLPASGYFILIRAILERSGRNGPAASAVILYLLLSQRNTAGFAMLQITDISSQ